MATTTTIRLPEDLKAHVASAAGRAGKTTHSFILEAIAEKAELEEQRADFDAEATAQFAEIVQSGKTIPWSDVRRYLEERLAGRKTPRPAAKRKYARGFLALYQYVDEIDTGFVLAVRSQREAGSART